MNVVCLRTVAVSVCLLAAGPAGCSRDRTTQQVAAKNQSNIQRVANLYAAFQHTHGGRGPASEAEFRGFVAAFDPAKLRMMGIDPANPGAVFTSERDGMPFRVRYDLGGGRGAADPVVFEQGGRDGTHQVAYTGGKVEAVDPDTSQQLWHRKASGARAKADPKSGGRPGHPPPGAPTGQSK